MKIFTKLKDLAAELADKKCVMTIGNFDGVHLGHQELIKGVVNKAKAENYKSVVVTFVPHPQKILHPQNAYYLINSYEERRKLIGSFGVNYLVELEFSRDFSTLSPEDFIGNHLFNGINVKRLCLGHDFAFGAQKKGDLTFIQDFCAKRDISVSILDKFLSDNEVISSSKIRSNIHDGNVEKVKKYLGRNFFVSGLVVRCLGRGKQIGFPTANIEVSSERIIPTNGVYISQTFYKDMLYNSVTNIGFNPTFQDQNRKAVSIETHIFDLIDQIKQDILFAKNHLSQ